MPCIAANDARAASPVRQPLRLAQSAINAVLDRTNLLAADKDVVVVGYGWVGKGIAARTRGLAARVTVCEVEPFAALEAHHDGFDVAPLVEACSTTNLVISATGVRGTMAPDAMAALPDGGLLCQRGAVDDEIDVLHLANTAVETRLARDHVEEFVRRRTPLFLVGAGVVVNLRRAGPPGRDHGHDLRGASAVGRVPAGARAWLEPKVHALPAELDEEVAG